MNRNPTNSYFLKVNNRNTIKRCEICSKLRGDNLLFIAKTPGPGTYFIYLGEMEDKVTQWFVTRDPWTGNPAP